jgi:uncharacterized coiled-coil protein SlyX
VATFVNKITENIIGYVVSLVVGAIFVMLMQSGAKEARLAVVEKRQEEQAVVIKDIQKTLAEGGPTALAQRVDALSKAMELQNAKLDRLLELVAARRPSP